MHDVCGFGDISEPPVSVQRVYFRNQCESGVSACMVRVQLQRRSDLNSNSIVDFGFRSGIFQVLGCLKTISVLFLKG